MSLNDYNLKAINDIYNNANLALLSISDLLPNVKDKSFIEELKYQHEGYERFIGEASAYMKANGIKPEETGFFQKSMMKMSIKMKSMINGSVNHLADMMIQGTVMGINELTAMKNEESNLSPEIKEYLTRLLALEENYNERLKKFL